MKSFRAIDILYGVMSLFILALIVVLNWVGYASTGRLILPRWLFFLFAAIFAAIGIFAGLSRFNLGYATVALGNGKRFLWIDPKGEKDERLVKEGVSQVMQASVFTSIFCWAFIATVVGPLLRLLIHAIRL